MSKKCRAYSVSKLGLEAPDNRKAFYAGWDAALRQALEQKPADEPVAWELRKGKTDRVLLEITNNAKRAHDWKCSLEEIVPLYTRPQPAAQWVGLTDGDAYRILEDKTTDWMQKWCAIEAKLKEKNAL